MLDDLLYLGMLTIPANLASAQESIRKLVAQGFPAPELFLNTPVKNPKHVDEVHRNIFEGHFSIVERFYHNIYPSRRHLHLLVLEDDAEALVPDAAMQIVDAVRRLERKCPNWSVLFLGCVPLGPSIPIGGGFVMTLAPFSAHGYVIRGREARTILQLTRKICRRPMFPEGCNIFPLTQRFALFTPLLTQTRTPKEFFFKDIPILKDYITFSRTMSALMWISCLVPPLLIAIFAVILCRLLSCCRKPASVGQG